MTERVNGRIIDDRLGFLMGENAFVSVAVGSAAGVLVQATGVLTPIAQFKALYALDPSKGIADSITSTVVSESPTTGLPVSTSTTVPNISVELRTFMIGGTSTVIATDADYLKFWSRQENLRRIVDIIQQRAVLMAMSKATQANKATVAGTGLGKWSVALAANANNSFVTFMVERGYVFDKSRPNMYGQPDSATVIGGELVSELVGLSLLADTGVAITGGLKAADVAVRIDRSVPAIGTDL